MSARMHYYLFFFFNDTATTEIYTLSLHDALPIYRDLLARDDLDAVAVVLPSHLHHPVARDVLLSGRHLLLEKPIDRKSTRLNSSHANISYAVFCLKKKNTLHQSCTPLSPQILRYT